LRGMRLLALLAVLLTIPASDPSPSSAQEGFHHGFVLTGWTADAYLGAASDEALQRMRAAGSDHAAVFTQWFLADPAASTLAPDAVRTPSDAALLHAMHTARRLGMEVTMKPQVAGSGPHGLPIPAPSGTATGPCCCTTRTLRSRPVPPRW
jgi:hypothetical protein